LFKGDPGLLVADPDLGVVEDGQDIVLPDIGAFFLADLLDVGR
jgi:hypothetical protein